MGHQKKIKDAPQNPTRAGQSLLCNMNATTPSTAVVEIRMKVVRRTRGEAGDQEGSRPSIIIMEAGIATQASKQAGTRRKKQKTARE